MFFRNQRTEASEPSAPIDSLDPSAPMIELSKVTHHYGIRPVLRNLDLEIRRGELVVIVGPNGMGKSTLLGVMGGALSPIKGHVSVGGLVRRSTPEAEIAIRRVAVYLPDRPWLPARSTGREYLLAVGRLYGVDYDRLFGHIDRLLALFDLADKGDTPIRGYSSGQQKKISLCAALVADAPILLLDEPFSGGLDPAGLAALKHVLRRRTRDNGDTVVLTSPVAEIVEEIADRVIILREGEIAAFDTLEGLRYTARTNGSLATILETLMYPETMKKLDSYFAESVNGA